MIATASNAVKNLLILPPLSQGIVRACVPGRLFGLYAGTGAHAMIESNDGKINSSGLVSGLSRADFIGGSCAGRARPQLRMGRSPSMRTTGAPTSDRVRRQFMMSGIVDVSDCAFPLLYFLLYRLPLAVRVSA